MKDSQKIIKYVGFGLAILLIVSIVMFIVNFFYNLSSSIFDDTTLKESVIKKIDDDIKNLDIDISNMKVNIKYGEEIKVEHNSKTIKVLVEDNTLVIKDKNKNNVINNNDKYLDLYIKKDVVFDDVRLDAGAVDLYVEDIECEKARFDLGVGNIKFDKLTINDKTVINAGAGDLKIHDFYTKYLDLDLGVGDSLIEGLIDGDATIDAGVGNLKLDLHDSLNMYIFKVDKGIGTMK